MSNSDGKTPDEDIDDGDIEFHSTPSYTNPTWRRLVSPDDELKNKYDAGAIDREEYREKVESFAGWCECPDCGWDGERVPILPVFGDGNVTAAVFVCPNCEYQFERHDMPSP